MLIKYFGIFILLYIFLSVSTIYAQTSLALEYIDDVGYIYGTNKLKNYKYEIDLYNQKLKLNATDGKIYFNRANSYINHQLSNEPPINGPDYRTLAINDYLDAIKYGYKEYEVYLNLGIAYYLSGNYTNAINSLKQAISINYYNGIAHLILAYSYGKFNDKANFIEHYTIASDFIIELTESFKDKILDEQKYFWNLNFLDKCLQLRPSEFHSGYYQIVYDISMEKFDFLSLIFYTTKFFILYHVGINYLYLTLIFIAYLVIRRTIKIRQIKQL